MQRHGRRATAMCQALWPDVSPAELLLRVVLRTESFGLALDFLTLVGEATAPHFSHRS